MGIRLGDRRFRSVGRDRRCANRSSGCEQKASRFRRMSRRCSRRARRVFTRTRTANESFYDLVARRIQAGARTSGRDRFSKTSKERTGVIKTNPGASLIDLGDGVACLEFHSKMNSIGGDTVSDDEFRDRRGRKEFQRPRRRQSGRQFFGRCEHHDAAARRAGRGVGRHQHDGRAPCRTP